MILRTVSSIGMCQAECTHSEAISLANGERLRVNRCPNGNTCIQAGALAVRYSAAELERIGRGNDQMGILEVATAIRENPAAMAYSALRPFDDTLAAGSI